jgi:tryptophan synthase beta subunit
MFREQGFQDAGNARQQAARGTYDPAYLNYTLGKLMIKQLREDWTANRGGRADWKAFHDQFLAYGGPPIPLVRGQMLATAPTAKLWSAQ